MEEAIDTRAPLEIVMFGTFGVRIDGVPLPPVRSRKVQWLLALLTLRHGREVERTWLASALWPESLEPQALFNLRQTLTHLRRALGSAGARIHTPTSHTLTLDLTGAAVDLIAFDTALARADPLSVEEAVALYHGPLLEGCLEEWCLPERQKREEACLNALESLAEAALGRGEPAGVIGSLRRVIGIDPLREQAQRGLMQALAMRGEVATAMQVYRDLRRYLHDNLQTTPDPETTALFEQIREQARRRARIAPGETVPTSSSHRLPAPLTNLIGRAQEVAYVQAILRTARLVTLLGPGGVGKTRLAIAVAQAMREEFAEGACFVDLAALTDSALLPGVVASALGVQATPQRSIPAILLEYLETRQILLVLDNCEHLIEACASLAATLLDAAPRLHILATSRQILGVTGEVSRQTPSLPFPTSALLLQVTTDKEWVSVLQEYEAVQLFVERARQASANFRLTPQNAPVIVRMCSDLDGLPLAIELAAAQTRALSVERIQARLESGMGLPASGDRTLLPRRQTLRATLDWSYALLTDPERILLRRLATFAGGWDLEAAEIVCTGEQISVDAVITLLTRLIDQSLVVHQTRGDDMGYRLLETIRQYGQERLAESGEDRLLRDRHRDYFVEFAEESSRKLQGSEQVVWLERLETEHDNLRAALGWSISQRDAGIALRQCSSMQQFWGMRYLDEGRGWCAAALALEGGAAFPAMRARALNVAGMLAGIQGDLAAAQSYLEEGLAIEKSCGNLKGIAVHTNNLGNIAKDRGDYALARTYFEASLAVYDELGDRPGASKALNNLGNVSRRQSDYVTAQRYLNQSLTIERELDDTKGIATALHNLSAVVKEQGRYSEARSYLQESLTIHRELGDLMGLAITLNSLGYLHTQEEDYVPAQRYFEQSLAIYQKGGGQDGVARLLNNMGEVAFKQNHDAVARDYFERGLAIHRKIGDKAGIADALNDLGNLNSSKSDYAAAKRCYQESLTLSRELGRRLNIAISLEAFATLALVSADTDFGRIVHLWSAARALREQIGAPCTPTEQRRLDREMAVLRPQLSEADWDRAWEEGRSLSLEQAIDAAFQR